MSAYIVKIIGRDELVGMFVVERLTDLGVAIDEICDPFICEYKSVKRGGMFWSDEHGKFDSQGVDCEGIQLSERLEDLVHEKDYWRNVSAIYKNAEHFYEVFMGR